MSFVSCGSDNKNDDGNGGGDTVYTIDLTRPATLAMSAEGIDTITVDVKTNLPLWKVTSNQTWCEVKALDGKSFIIASKRNASKESPASATVTVGNETMSKTLTVTQAGATKDGIVAYISKKWIFADGSDYSSLEFISEGKYTLFGSNPFTMSNDAVTYSTTGAYTVSDDFNTVNLEGFGVAVLEDLKANNLKIAITPTGGTKKSFTTSKQVINGPGASSDKQIKEFNVVLSEDEYNNFRFVYGADKKLSEMIMSFNEGGQQASFTNTIAYSENKVTMTLPGKALGDNYTEDKVEYLLNKEGLAYKVNFYGDSKLIETVLYSYNSKKEIVAFTSFNANGNELGHTTAQWNAAGNITSINLWAKIDWDSDNDGIPDDDYNGDGELDDNDKISFEYNNISSIIYSEHKTKGNFVVPMFLPNIYRFDDVFDFTAMIIGILGKPTTNIVTSFPRGSEPEETNTVTVDAEGYLNGLTMTDSRSPGDIVTATFKFE